MNSPANSLEAVETRLGFNFHNRQLLLQALTHRSWCNEHRSELPRGILAHNERLEFLGDAIIDFIVAEYLCTRFPGLDEGELTILRSAVVRSETLAGLARQLELASDLRLSRGEERTGARSRVPMLADTFEAIIGAVFVDQGLTAARAVGLKLLGPIIERVHMVNSVRDAKSILQEVAQAYFQLQPQYQVVDLRGAEHCRIFVIAVLIGDEERGRGEGLNKHRAEQAAAYAALIRLRSEFALGQ